MRKSSFSTAFAMASLVIVAACASSSGSATPDTVTPQPSTGTATSMVRIENNRPDAGRIIVFIHPEVGPRVQLGTVDPNQTGSFNYNAQSGYYSLLAQQQSGGSDIRSERFRLSNEQIASWNMQVGSRVLVRNK